jgi:hypothetical protein
LFLQPFALLLARGTKKSLRTTGAFLLPAGEIMFKFSAWGNRARKELFKGEY